MKRLTSLWCSLAQELGDQFSVHVDHDIKNVMARVDNEGISFLTITLPSYGADFEASLREGVIDSTYFRSFRKNGRAPAFLRGFLSRVFDTQSGSILTVPDVDAIFAVRQLTLFFKKVEMPANERRVNAAYARYVECDLEVGDVAAGLRGNPSLVSDLGVVFTQLYWRVLRRADKSVQTYSLVPGHGPGASADLLKGNRKWRQIEWPQRFEDTNLFPYKEYVLPRYGLTLEPQLLAPEQERPVKVIHVPKTQTTPRIIAEEPTCMMYMQKALARELTFSLEADRLVGPLIGFTDQEPNQVLACTGSVDGSLATIDLKEASDRVPYWLVEQLVKPVAPHLWEAIDACRSKTADVRGMSVQLNKFASMGSALCFPVEAMVFLAIVVLGIKRALDRPLSESDISSFAEKVRVYGDDIIVPVAYARLVVESLQDFGLVVNGGKSFYTGNFRESCGGDFYDGVFITPIRARNFLPSSREDVDLIVTWTATMNQLYERGLWLTAKVVQDILEGILGPLPIVRRGSQAIGLYSFQGAFSGTRMSPKLHVPQVKAWVPRWTKNPLAIGDYWALRKCFVGDYSDPEYSKHLDTSGRPLGVKLIREWVEVDELSSRQIG